MMWPIVRGEPLKQPKSKTNTQAGFTLIELMIVLTMLSILVTLVAPAFLSSTDRAREATLKADLYTFRDTIDQFRADQGRYPATLSELVEMKYLRSIPIDPITEVSDTWVEVPSDSGGERGGVFDVKSGSNAMGTNNLPYNQW